MAKHIIDKDEAENKEIASTLQNKLSDELMEAFEFVISDRSSHFAEHPDFLFLDKEGNYVMVEVKADNKIDDPIVLAKKAFAEQMTAASGMRYEVVKGSEVNKSLNVVINP